VITQDQLKDSMLKMAAVVDTQNVADPSYQPMVGDKQPSGYAYQAAWDLVMSGVLEPSGYTEPALHRNRAQKKGH
jgi:malate synthase